MRISNNQKRMLTTHILSLFLTAAVPFSLFSIPTSSAIAAGRSVEVAPVEVVPGGMSLVSKIEQLQEGALAVDRIILREEGEPSRYNLGQGQRALQQILEKQDQSRFLNDLLPAFRTSDSISQAAPAEEVAKMIYDCFRFAAEMIRNNTSEVGDNRQKLNLKLETATRLYDVMKVSFAYQNVLQALLDTQQRGLAAAKATCNEKNEALQRASAKEEGRLTTAHTEVIAGLQKQISDTQNSITTLQEAFQATNKPQGSTEHRQYQNDLGILQATLSSLNEQSRAASLNFEQAKTIRTQLLAQKQRENELEVEKLKETYAKEKDNMMFEFSFIFEGLGRSIIPKWLARAYHGRTISREDYNYRNLDKELLSNPKLLRKAQSTLDLAIYKVYKEHLKASSTSVPEREIFKALLNYLKITSASTGSEEVSDALLVSHDGDSKEEARGVRDTPVTEARGAGGPAAAAPTATPSPTKVKKKSKKGRRQGIV